MKVISVRSAWHLFVLALLVLAAIAYFGDRAAQGYATSEDWVSHTREVEAQISLLRAEMSVAWAASSQRRFRVCRRRWSSSSSELFRSP